MNFWVVTFPRLTHFVSSGTRPCPLQAEGGSNVTNTATGVAAAFQTLQPYAQSTNSTSHTFQAPLTSTTVTGTSEVPRSSRFTQQTARDQTITILVNESSFVAVFVLLFVRASRGTAYFVLNSVPHLDHCAAPACSLSHHHNCDESVRVPKNNVFACVVDSLNGRKFTPGKLGDIQIYFRHQSGSPELSFSVGFHPHFHRSSAL